MGQRLGRGQVVDGHHLHIGARGQDGTEEVPSDAAEPIDADPYRHPHQLPFRALSQQTGEGQRQSARTVDQGCLGEGHVDQVDGHPTPGQAQAGVAQDDVDGHAVPGQGGHVVRHVEALRLGHLGAEVADVDLLAPASGQGLRNPGTATAASTLVNSDPGPMTIWSAASIRSTACGGGR